MVINSVDYIGEDTNFPGDTGQVRCIPMRVYILKSSLAKIVELDSTT